MLHWLWKQHIYPVPTVPALVMERICIVLKNALPKLLETLRPKFVGSTANLLFVVPSAKVPSFLHSNIKLLFYIVHFLIKNLIFLLTKIFI